MTARPRWADTAAYGADWLHVGEVEQEEEDAQEATSWHSKLAEKG